MCECAEPSDLQITVTKISEAIESGNIGYLKAILHEDLCQPSKVTAFFESMILKARNCRRSNEKLIHEIKYYWITEKEAKVLIVTPWGAPWSPDTPEDLVYEFRKERETWKIVGLEGICIPIFYPKRGETVIPPTFPASQSKWINTEFGWSVASRESFYQYIEKEKGAKVAVEYLQSQAEGIAIAVRAWVPFVRGPAKLAIYDATVRCSIHGSQAKVEMINENEAKLTFSECLEAKVADAAIMGFPRQVTRNEYCKHCTIIFMAASRKLDLKARRKLIKDKKGNLGCMTYIENYIQ